MYALKNEVSLDLKDHRVCSLKISGSISLDDAPELVGSILCLHEVCKCGSVECFHAFLSAKERTNCATKVHLCLVFSYFSDCLSAMPCIIVYGVMTQHTEKAEMVVGME